MSWSMQAKYLCYRCRLGKIPQPKFIESIYCEGKACDYDMLVVGRVKVIINKQEEVCDVKINCQSLLATASKNLRRENFFQQ